MSQTLTIKASTTDAEIETISFLDMRQEATERRNDAAAVIDEQGDQTVLELHEVDGCIVLYSPTFGYALVNQQSVGVGDSLLVNDTTVDGAVNAYTADA